MYNNILVDEDVCVVDSEHEMTDLRRSKKDALDEVMKVVSWFWTADEFEVSICYVVERIYNNSRNSVYSSNVSSKFKRYVDLLIEHERCRFLDLYLTRVEAVLLFVLCYKFVELTRDDHIKPKNIAYPDGKIELMKNVISKILVIEGNREFRIKFIEAFLDSLDRGYLCNKNLASIIL